jgi:hypothetical protein
MKRVIKIILIVTLTITNSNTYSQITKGYWMLGGGAGFANTKSTNGDSSADSTGFSISPNIGYFVIDNLAIGTSGEFSYTFESENTKTFNSNSISPFIKYYFLDKEKIVNIFSEARYEIMRLKESDFKTDKINLKVGVVFFLNSTAGLEVALNYSKQKTNQDFENRVIYLNVGFQIHLERK